MCVCVCCAGEDLQYDKPGAERSRRRRGEEDDLDRYWGGLELCVSEVCNVVVSVCVIHRRARRYYKHLLSP